MHEFYLQGRIYMQLIDMMRNRKKTERKSKMEQKKNTFGYPPISPVSKMKIDCFPISTETENEPDLL